MSRNADRPGSPWQRLAERFGDFNPTIKVMAGNMHLGMDETSAEAILALLDELEEYRSRSAAPASSLF